MPILKKAKNSYHHGNLAESLLDAVDEIATKFGLEAVSLRACAKLVGVSPSSAFRHYADKRGLLTAFATRALHQLSEQMAMASQKYLLFIMFPFVLRAGSGGRNISTSLDRTPGCSGR